MDIGYDPYIRLDERLDFKKFLDTLDPLDACIYVLHKIDKCNYKQIGDLFCIDNKKVKKLYEFTDIQFSLFFKK